MAKYKYKLKEMSKTASPEDAAKELNRKPGEKFKVGQVTYSKDGVTKSTITDIDPVTGAVRWKVEQLPGFEKLYNEMDEAVAVAKRVYVKTKNDTKFRDFYEELRSVRNKIRTHLRNEYPDEYKRMANMEEASVTNSGGATFTPGTGAQYATPYAFSKGKKVNRATKYAYKLGYKPAPSVPNRKSKAIDYKKVMEVNEIDSD